MNKQTAGTYTTYLFDRDNTPMIAKQNMYFLPIKRSELSNNPNLEQTKGWENGYIRSAGWTVIVNNRPHLRIILQKDGIPLELLTIRTECRPFYALL